MKKSILAIIVVIILLVGGFYWATKYAKAPADDTASSTQTGVEPTPAPTITETVLTATGTSDKSPTPTGVFSSGEENADGGSDIQVVEVSYDGKAFTPDVVNIKVGDYVIFRNNSTADFWPASGPHPTHSAYPEFDPGKPIPPGGKFQFQFMKVGNWSFHEHISDNAEGVVNVTAK